MKPLPQGGGGEDGMGLPFFLSRDSPLHMQILDGALLLTIDLRGQEQGNQVPGFEDEFQHAVRYS
jgi:hypothetical protein